MNALGFRWKLRYDTAIDATHMLELGCHDAGDVGKQHRDGYVYGGPYGGYGSPVSPPPAMNPEYGHPVSPPPAAYGAYAQPPPPTAYGIYTQQPPAPAYGPYGRQPSAPAYGN
eukprot:XP_001697599.1 predicted protein [Chlamydomonas reinhardtii]